MRITFSCSTTETLEYLRTVNMVLRSNRTVEEDVKAYNALKSVVESLTERLNRIEAERRNRVCR